MTEDTFEKKGCVCGPSDTSDNPYHPDCPVHGSPIPLHIGRHPNSARFHQILQELGELHDLKQKDYGKNADPFFNARASSEWGMPGWVGAMMRASDKMRRLQSLARTGKLALDRAENDMRDIAVYAVIALVLYEDEAH